MKEYIVSPVTVYDDDNQLWGTKVGCNGKDMPLLCVAYGKTEEKGRAEAEKIASLYSNSENKK